MALSIYISLWSRPPHTLLYSCRQRVLKGKIGMVVVAIHYPALRQIIDWITALATGENQILFAVHGQGVTKRCRLSWLTNSALVYTSPKAGGWLVAGSQPMSKAAHITWHGAQINFGDLSPYLTNGSGRQEPRHGLSRENSNSNRSAPSAQWNLCWNF